ncbi:arginase, hepatic-like [Anneissia japonica]|uniref:arginase, hepatic-like n=1 Tax=Anneissia japonica TaxID=1529436 RepID=UPI0014259CED|nr:arginase, hepatic-like [Anneissia japonica]
MMKSLLGRTTSLLLLGHKMLPALRSTCPILGGLIRGTYVASLSSRGLSQAQAPRNIGIIGAPINKGQGKSGTRLGPQTIRDVGLIQQLKDIERDVKDYGDIKFPEMDEDMTSMRPVKNSRFLGKATQMISNAVYKIMKEDKRLCLTLGGDHALSVGSVHGHARVNPNLCLLWIDAHADLNTPLTSMSGNLHGMVQSFLVHELTDYMPTVPGFDWIKPCISLKDIVYIGLRDIDPGEKYIMEKFGMTGYSIHDVDKLGVKEVLSRALETVNPMGDRPIHLSYDIDSLDPVVSPSTGTPVMGGLTYREGMYIAEVVSDTGLLHAVDVVELNPELGTPREQDTTIMAAMNIVTASLGKVREGHRPKIYELPKP